jgi:hypothetical protein
VLDPAVRVEVVEATAAEVPRSDVGGMDKAAARNKILDHLAIQESQAPGALSGRALQNEAEGTEIRITRAGVDHSLITSGRDHVDVATALLVLDDLVRVAISPESPRNKSVPATRTPGPGESSSSPRCRRTLRV